MSGRRRAFVVLAAVATVVVAAVVAFVGLRGNGSGVGVRPTATPSSTPVVSPTQTATPTPTVAAPELPAAAQKRSQEGAEAFFRYFIDVYNYGYAALDPSVVESISDSKCRYCASVVRDIKASRDKGLRFEDGLVSVAGSLAAPDQNGLNFTIVAFIDQTAGTIYRADGTVEETSDAVKNQRADVTLTWVDGAWRMRAVVVSAK